VRCLSFPTNTTDECFTQILTTFTGLDTTRTAFEQTKLSTGPEWLRFAHETYRQHVGAFLIISCYYGWKLFWSNLDDNFDMHNIEAGKFENEVWITRFCIPTLFWVWLLSFLVNTTNNVSVEFWQLFRARMTLFCTQNITTMFGVHCLSIRVSTTENCFGQILMSIPSTNITWAGKPENQARITRFCTRNIPTLLGVQFLSFHVHMA